MLSPGCARIRQKFRITLCEFNNNNKLCRRRSCFIDCATLWTPKQDINVEFKADQTAELIYLQVIVISLGAGANLRGHEVAELLCHQPDQRSECHWKEGRNQRTFRMIIGKNYMYSIQVNESELAERIKFC